MPNFWGRGILGQKEKLLLPRIGFQFVGIIPRGSSMLVSDLIWESGWGFIIGMEFVCQEKPTKRL
jgi:hypothetical protein